MVFCTWILLIILYWRHLNILFIDASILYKPNKCRNVTLNTKNISNAIVKTNTCQKPRVLGKIAFCKSYIKIFCIPKCIDGRYNTRIYAHNESVHANNIAISSGIQDICKIQLKGASMDDGKAIQCFVDIGKTLYNNTNNIGILKQPPNILEHQKSFTLDNSDYFLFKPPKQLQYNLLRNCISSVYIGVHVDTNLRVHVDGTSDSLVAKGVLALILNAVNSHTFEHVMNVRREDIPYYQNISNVGFMKRNGVDIILDHVKEQCQIQANKISNISTQNQLPITVIHQTKFVLIAMRVNISNRVAVLVSGGVDSSVALWLLKNRGFNVQAFYLKVWGIAEDGTKGDCPWAIDIDHAMQVCNYLNVPLHILPFQEIYKNKIIEPFIASSKAGETPNPDIECNNFIKFGAFLKYALNWGFEYVATGHYARICNKNYAMESPKTLSILTLARDTKKDQTYFLSRLYQDQLKRILLPIGDFKKKQVRKIAKAANLITFDRPDSTGLCFLGNIDVGSFLQSKIGETEGPIADYETGTIIGRHKGLYHYAIGQREDISSQVFEDCNPSITRNVVAKDAASNTLYVTSMYHTLKYIGKGGLRRGFNVSNIKWNIPHFKQVIQSKKIASKKDISEYQLKIKTKHTPRFLEANVTFNKAFDNAWISIKEPDSGISTGQYAVFYSDNLCIGAGKMETPKI
ncbi:bifunctional tRNA-specific 2-thiouridylase/Rossmann-like alpha-beta-alpha sandwich fold/Fe-S metabolism associated domain [Babesia duncani]|uniref:tRNA-5-taurinomethyluridine 2-sulfurtransferase n=1 Tax=Babesia duncani TaxID=323732 RepID=A0AAD9UP70_9APIC|nr:bifunctional tRNA-specific 2-thiouridylase/Rossmann-like alpha-beta-alpha sandwich fold/Fe-S metabolism associated domain [Babesia duncani]